MNNDKCCVDVLSFAGAAVFIFSGDVDTSDPRKDNYCQDTLYSFFAPASIGGGFWALITVMCFVVGLTDDNK